MDHSLVVAPPAPTVTPLLDLLELTREGEDIVVTCKTCGRQHNFLNSPMLSWIQFLNVYITHQGLGCFE